MRRLSIGLMLFAGIATAQNAPKPSVPMPADWNGFANSAADKGLVSSIQKMKWWDACVAWGREARSGKDPRRQAALNAFLKDGKMVSYLDSSHVMDRSVEIGMTECGLFASRGMPEAANHTTTSHGTTSQLVYRTSGLYVYTEESPLYSVKVVRSYQH